ncbi:MAG: DUF2865 domain-containing protein, partial [Pseudomonadota bacterium]
MRRAFLNYRIAAVVLVLAASFAVAPTAHARDFFTSFFGGMMNDNGHARAPSTPFAPEFGDPAQPKRVDVYGGRYGGGSTAFCVRTCDGRYFPLTATKGQSRADACKSFCPASDTKVVLGSDIDNAATETGKPYSALPNAFKYRNELVAGCTCNGKTSAGLALVKIEDDPTLRKGDIVAGPNGLMVASGNKNRSAS